MIGTERIAIASGTYNFTTIQGDRVYARHVTSGNVANVIGSNALPVNNSPGGTTTLMDGYRTFPSVNNTGNVTTFNGYNCNGQSINSTGRITTARGFNVDNLGHVGTPTCIGFRAGDQTHGTAGFTVGFYSLLNSATGKWGVMSQGTANNAFAGNTRFGSIVAPTATVDITGTLAVSGNVSMTGGNITNVNSNANLELGAATTNTPYIDFHSGATVVDYDSRIIASGGNGASAGGTLSLHAATIELNGTVALQDRHITGIRTATFATTPIKTTTTGAVTIDWTAGQNQIQNEPTGAITYTFTAPAGPCHLQLLIASDGTSTAYTHVWPASVKWMGATWAQVANKAAIINFWYDGTNYYAMGVNQV